MSDTLKPEGSLPFVMKYKSVISFSMQWIKMPQSEVLQIRVIIDLHPKTFGRGSTDPAAQSAGQTVGENIWMGYHSIY